MEADAYFSSIDTTRQASMNSIRQLMFELYPTIVETMDYRMPTYILEGETLCALASQKNYMALYIMPHDLLDEFKPALKAYNCGKSCIRFKKIDQEGLQLFRRILEYTGTNYPNSQFYGKMNAKKK